jgi:hypothetical protein
MQTRYVNTASTAGGNGTTNATAGANRAFATLAEAETALSGTLSEPWTFICSGGLDSSDVGFGGFTTSAANYVLVTVDSGSRHNGIPGTGYRLKPAVNDAGIIRVAVGYIRFVGLEIDGGSATGTVQGVGMTSAPDTCDIRVEECLIHNCSSYGIYFNPTQNKVLFANNILYSNGRAIYSTGDNATAYAYNCTAVSNGDYGMLRCVFKNCLSSGHSTGDFLAAQTGSINNASSDGTASGTGSRTSQTFTFVNSGSGDYHLASGDAGAKDFGSDLSADAVYPISTDIDGATRSGSWDIGADEITSAPARRRNVVVSSLPALWPVAWIINRRMRLMR